MHLQVSETEAAGCFFLANFILLPNTVTNVGHLNYIIPLLKTTDESSPLRYAFAAVSFAAFSAQPSSRALLSKAKLNYVQALKHINVALADPKQTKGDSIMATTLLLTVYEVGHSLAFRSTHEFLHLTGTNTCGNRVQWVAFAH